MLVELFKFYLELIVQSGILAGAVLGGIFSYLSKQKDLVFKLRLIPSLLSAIFAVIFGISFWPSVELSSAISLIGKNSNLTLTPHAWLLPLTVAFFFLVFSGICVVSFYLPKLFKKRDNFYNNQNKQNSYTI